MYAGITLISIMDQDLIANVPLLAVIFWLVDIIFCGIFVIELWLKIYAFGLPHFKNPLEFLDAVVIIVSVGLVIAEQAAIFDGHTAADESENHGSSAAAAMRLLASAASSSSCAAATSARPTRRGGSEGSVSNKAYIYRMCMFTFVLGILFVIQARARATPARATPARNSAQFADAAPPPLQGIVKTTEVTGSMLLSEMLPDIAGQGTTNTGIALVAVSVVCFWAVNQATDKRVTLAVCTATAVTICVVWACAVNLANGFEQVSQHGVKLSFDDEPHPVTGMHLDGRGHGNMGVATRRISRRGRKRVTASPTRRRRAMASCTPGDASARSVGGISRATRGGTARARRGAARTSGCSRAARPTADRRRRAPSTCRTDGIRRTNMRR